MIFITSSVWTGRRQKPAEAEHRIYGDVEKPFLETCSAEINFQTNSICVSGGRWVEVLLQEAESLFRVKAPTSWDRENAVFFRKPA